MSLLHLSTYKEFHVPVSQLSIVANLFYLPLFLASIINHRRRSTMIELLYSHILSSPIHQVVPLG